MKNRLFFSALTCFIIIAGIAGTVMSYPVDFDGDGTDDLWDYDTTTHVLGFHKNVPVNLNNPNLFTTLRITRTEGFGAIKAVPADYDGDGTTDIAFYHQADGMWYIHESLSGTIRTQQFGWADADPVPADYDGDGKCDIAVYHPEGPAVWYILKSSGGTEIVQFGWNGPKPVPADYDGDGNAELAIYDQVTGNWWIEGYSPMPQQFGWADADPVPADYDGDGKCDIAVYHPEGPAVWYILKSSGGTEIVQFGWNGPKPVPADYDGDGKADISVYRRVLNRWYYRPSSGGGRCRHSFLAFT